MGEPLPKIITLAVILTVIAVNMTGCVGDFAIFSYTAEMEFQDGDGVVDAEPQPVGADGETVDTAYTTPIPMGFTGNPAIDIISTLVAKTETVEAAKFLAAALAGDPASITALRASGFKKVRVEKRVLPIRTKGYEKVRLKAEQETKDSK